MAGDIKIGLPVVTPGPFSAGRNTRTGEEDVEKAARDFESFLIFTMLKEFEKTARFTKKGYAEETYMSVVHEKVAEVLAKKGLGIKEMLSRYADRTDAKVFAGNGDNKGK